MPKSSKTLCLACAVRAANNRSGTARCDGKAPCSSCRKNHVECTYEPLPPTKETTMVIIDKSDDCRVIRFLPDPDGLGEVDAIEASDHCLPEDLPANSYATLVAEKKRKHVQGLVRFEKADAPLAKRLRGGVEGVEGVDEGEEQENQGQQHPPPPPPPSPPRQQIPAGPVDPNLANMFNFFATQQTAQQNATNQLFGQLMDRMDTNKRDPVRGNTNRKKPFKFDLIAPFVSSHSRMHKGKS